MPFIRIIYKGYVLILTPSLCSTMHFPFLLAKQVWMVGRGGCFEKDEHSSNQCLSTERAECVYRHSWSDASSIQLTRRMLGTVYSQTYRPCSVPFLTIIKYICATIWTRFSLCENQDSAILMGILIMSLQRYYFTDYLAIQLSLIRNNGLL